MQISTAKNTEQITIRKMDIADIPAMRDLAERIWRKHYVPDVVTAEQIEFMLKRLYSDEAILHNIKENKQCFWLLYCDDELKGYGAVEPRENSEWWIDKLYVDIKTQRSGLGSILLEHIIKNHHPKTLTLRVHRKNYKAVNFYFRHGFSITGLNVLDIGQNFLMDDFFMKKVL